LILVIKKRHLFFLLSFFILGISLGTYNLAIHPDMRKWEKEKIVISQIDTNQRIIALTFDDGPDAKFTSLMLDVLKKHEIKATFFVLGAKCEKNPELIYRIYKEGHEIGNHSYSHANFNHKDQHFILNEIRQTNAIIHRLTGKKPWLFRPPGGYLSYDLVDICKAEDLTIAYWTYQQDSKDWKNGLSAKHIANHIINNIAPGQIIILHDGCPNANETVKAVDILVPQLKKQGYQFVPLGDLINLQIKE